MSSKIRNLWWLALASLLVAGSALAQSGSATGSAETQAAASAADDAAASAAAKARADAAVSASLDEAREAIQKKASRISAKARAKAHGQLEASAASVDQAVQTQGEAKVAGRLASELGVDADALMAEQERLGCGWGDLMIAHALDANAKTDLTSEQLVQLHNGGMGWGEIAAGLDLNLGSVVSGLKAESRVATGLARGDGRVAVMTGAGARVGAGVGVKSGVGVGTGVNAGVGAGVKIGKK